jgi:hypothetical protein
MPPPDDVGSTLDPRKTPLRRGFLSAARDGELRLLGTPTCAVPVPRRQEAHPEPSQEFAGPEIVAA